MAILVAGVALALSGLPLLNLVDFLLAGGKDDPRYALENGSYTYSAEDAWRMIPRVAMPGDGSRGPGIVSIFDTNSACVLKFRVDDLTRFYSHRFITTNKLDFGEGYIEFKDDFGDPVLKRY